jgi:hypothetical protein
LLHASPDIGSTLPTEEAADNSLSGEIFDPRKYSHSAKLAFIIRGPRDPSKKIQSHFYPRNLGEKKIIATRNTAGRGWKTS